MLANNFPKISVITIVLNAKDLVERAIQSVVQQNYPNLEYIIIDGGSTDGTVDIIRKYAEYITYWQSKPDGGTAAALNIGLEHATGEFIAFLHADDWYTANTLAKIAETYQNHPDADIITCGSKIVIADPVSEKHHDCKIFNTDDELELSLKNIFFGHSLFCPRFYKRNIFVTVGNFQRFDKDGNVYIANDHELLLKILFKGVKNINIAHIGYIHLAHKGSATIGRNVPKTTWRKYLPTIKQIRKEHLALGDYYLAQNYLNKEQRAIFKRWHCDQIVRLFICEIYTRQWHAAWRVAKRAFGHHHFRLLIPLFSVPFSIIKNRIKNLTAEFG